MNIFKELKHFDNRLYLLDPDLRFRSKETLKKLAVTLIEEEFEELMEAFGSDSPRHIAKELCDLIYVCVQALIRLYSEPDEIWRRVHQSNLSKFGDDAEIREDGKLLKSASYEPPDLTFIDKEF